MRKEMINNLFKQDKIIGSKGSDASEQGFLLYKKFILSILLFVILLTSCGIKGVYKHTICDIGTVCYAYEFCNDGLFRYKFIQEGMGSGVIQGTWTKNGDTLTLLPEKRDKVFVSNIETYTDYLNEGKSIRALDMIKVAFRNL
jgi:hypothetical protein